MATKQEHFNACRQFQEFYDQTLSKIGSKAPAPVLGQKLNDYRRETLRQLKRTFLPQNHELYQIQMRSLEPDVLAVFEPQVLRAVEKEAVNPANFAPGEIRPIQKTYKDGQKYIDFYGQHSFVRDMTRPGRRVVSFTTSNGRYDAMKGRYF